MSFAVCSSVATVTEPRSRRLRTRKVTAMKVTSESMMSVMTRATPVWDLRFIGS